MSSQIAPITLADLQRPVRARLERVPHELVRPWRLEPEVGIRLTLKVEVDLPQPEQV